MFHYSLKSLGGRSSPIVPRILSPKKGTGRTLGNSQQSKHAQPSNDVARSLFKDGIQKLEVNNVIKDSQPATITPIGNKSADALDEKSLMISEVTDLENSISSDCYSADKSKTTTDPDDSPKTTSFSQNKDAKEEINIDLMAKKVDVGFCDTSSKISSTTTMNVSIANGKIKSVRSVDEESRINLDKPETLESDMKNQNNEKLENFQNSEGSSNKEGAMKKAITLIDLLTPLDGKNINEIDEESSSIFSNSSLKLTRNDMGLLEVKDNLNSIELENAVENRNPLHIQEALSPTQLEMLSSLPSSDSDESDSIDLTCNEDAPSSPSPKKDGDSIDSKHSNSHNKRSTKQHSETSKSLPSKQLGNKSSESTFNSRISLNPKIKEDEEIFCCEGCGCYGMSGEFLNSEACSASCQERIVQRIREREKKERELLIQKQRREARKKEREAKEAAEEAARRKVAEAEVLESAKKVKEAQRISMKALHDANRVLSRENQAEQSNDSVLQNSTTESLNCTEGSGKNSYFSDKSEGVKIRLKLVDGNVDAASVITEGPNTQVHSSRLTSTSKASSQNSYSIKSESENKQLPPDIPPTLPWQDNNTKTGFSWTKYLEATHSKIAPSKIFEETARFPHSTNRFKVGMKLEAIDPEHPALFCVVTVVSVRGYRIRLHFDGYSDSYDFWENANSRNIFPPGWCKQQRQRLETPNGWKNNNNNRNSLDSILSFTWQKYMADEGSSRVMVKGRRQTLAPKQIFTEPPKLPQNWLAGWNVGMKLEAVDKHNAALVCVATVGNILSSDGRILIHFDGWEIEYDYWVKPDSPFIKPKGWCEQNGVTLNKPKGYRGDFKWDKYLEETGCRAVPAWAFRSQKSNNTSLFRRGMKIEAVDKRNPVLIRVATVADVVCHQLRVSLECAFQGGGGNL